MIVSDLPANIVAFLAFVFLIYMLTPKKKVRKVVTLEPESWRVISGEQPKIKGEM